MTTISDFRYLDVSAHRDRVQIEHGLLEMGTDPEIIFWFFLKFDDLKSEYTEQLNTQHNYETDA